MAEHGPELPISALQVQKVLGDSTLTDMAEKGGISAPDAANALSSLLPQVIDKISRTATRPPRTTSAACLVPSENCWADPVVESPSGVTPKPWRLKPVQSLCSASLVANHSGWPILFEHEREGLQAALGALAQRIEHNGSTSVPGLAAKPVIDIQISVSQIGPIDRYRTPLESLGYCHVAHEDDMFVPSSSPKALAPHLSRSRRRGRWRGGSADACVSRLPAGSRRSRSTVQ